MTNTALVGDDDLISDAGFDGIGRRTAQHLESVGLSTVRQLADAHAPELATALEPSFPNLRPDTLGARVEQWIEQARHRVHSANERSARGHVFLLTIWTDGDGRPLRSRVDHRQSDEPTSDVTTADFAGWSPAAFARFVERSAHLVNARSLTAERSEPITEVVEWSQHSIEGQLVRGGSAPIEIRAQVTTDDVDGDGDEIRYRVSGRLSPLGGGPPIALGTCTGRVDRGSPMMLEFGAHHVPPQVHRAWFDVSVSPPAPDDATLLAVHPPARR
jgi:hypothetical protein